MSPDLQRATIAAALGTHTVKTIRRSWNPGTLPEEDVLEVTDRNGRKSLRWLTFPASSTHQDYESPPDFLNDLNAMRDAELWLEYHAVAWYGVESDSSAPEAYMNHLKTLVDDDDWLFMGAPADLRAKAFLLTLNLYVE